MPRKLTKEQFIEKAKLIHGDKYDYSLVIYKNNHTDVDIICSIHQTFPQKPTHHLRGHGCPKCGGSYNRNTEEFINQAKVIHGDKYDYSLVNYINSNIPIEIICSIHQTFPQKPHLHLSGHECPKCANKNVTTEEFIEKAIKKHGKKYDYSQSSYINSKLDIDIICPIHGLFNQTPNEHLNNGGCKKCGDERVSIMFRLNTIDFINKAKIIHGDKYDYSLVNYKKNSIIVDIICPIHGSFPQIPNSHLNGAGCSKCAGNYNKTTEEFISQAKLIHGDKYDYSLTKYVIGREPIEIICLMHGPFNQMPESHLTGSGCPTCVESRGERSVRIFLEKNNIKHVKEKRFKNCKGIKSTLPFDFYLPDLNILIEYDGRQHFEVNEFFGGINNFNLLKINDNIKTEFAKSNNINLIRIAYNENVEEKLSSILLPMLELEVLV